MTDAELQRVEAQIEEAILRTEVRIADVGWGVGVGDNGQWNLEDSEQGC